MSGKGSKDKSKREQQKIAQLNPNEWTSPKKVDSESVLRIV